MSKLTVVAKLRGDSARVRCPYCHERIEFFVDPDTSGHFVEDCAVCCRPWAVQVSTDSDGERVIDVAAAQ